MVAVLLRASLSCLLLLVIAVSANEHQPFILRLQERHGKLAREPRIPPLDLYDPMILGAHNPMQSPTDPKSFSGRVKVADHIHGSSYLDYQAAFRHHVYNIDFHYHTFEDILCARNGMYFRTSDGEDDEVYGLEQLVSRHGHVLASASTWDCTEGIEGVVPQEGPIYRRIEGIAETIAPNIIFVPTSPQLGLLDLIPDGFIKYSFRPPSTASHEKRGGVSHTWGFNYDTTTKRAQAPIIKTKAGEVPHTTGLTYNVTFYCKNCYAYLTVGCDLEFDWGLTSGVKNFKFAATGEAGLEADYEILFDLQYQYSDEFEIIKDLKLGSITFALGWLPVEISFSASLTAQLDIDAEFKALFTHNFGASGYAVMGTQYTKGSNGFSSINSFPAPTITIGNPAFSYHGDADVRFTLLPTLQAALWTVVPLDVTFKPYIGVEMAFPDLDNCPSTTSLGYQTYWGVDVEFSVAPLQFDAYFTSVTVNFGGLLPLTADATLASKRYILCSVCSGCVGSATGALLYGSGAVKPILQPDSYFFYLDNITIDESMWQCSGTDPAMVPTCNTYVRTYWCEGIPLSDGAGNLFSNSPKCDLGDASSSIGPSDNPVWKKYIAAYSYSGQHGPNISLWVVVYNNMYTYLSPYNPVLMDAYYVLSSCNQTICTGAFHLSEPVSPNGTMYFAVGQVPKLSLGTFSGMVDIKQQDMYYFQIAVPPNMRTWATSLYLKAIASDGGDADLYINDDVQVPFLPTILKYQQRSIQGGDYEITYIDLTPYPAYSGTHNNISVNFAVGVYAYTDVQTQLYSSPYADFPLSQFTTGLGFTIDSIPVNEFWHVYTHWAAYKSGTNEIDDYPFQGVVFAASGLGGDLDIYVLTNDDPDSNNTGWKSSSGNRGVESLIIYTEDLLDPVTSKWNTDLSLYLYSSDDLPTPYSGEPVTDMVLYTGFYYTLDGMGQILSMQLVSCLSYMVAKIPLDLSVPEFRVMEIELQILGGTTYTGPYYILVQPWDSVTEEVPTPDKFDTLAIWTTHTTYTVVITQEQFITHPSTPDKVLIGVWTGATNFYVEVTVTPVFEVASGQEMKALLLFGNQDFYKVQIPLRDDIPDSSVLIEVGDSAGAIVINTFEPYDSIIILFVDSNPNITLKSTNFTTGYVNLKITASGISTSAIASATVTQSFPLTISNDTSSVGGSSNSSGDTVFAISLPTSPEWGLGAYLTVIAESGDPDLFVSLTDSYVQTSDWSSRRYGDDSLAVPIDTIATRNVAQPSSIFVAVSYTIATSYNLSFIPLKPALGALQAPNNLTAQDVRSGNAYISVVLTNTQYRFVDWIATSDETALQVIQQLNGTSNETTGWNALVQPILLSNANSSLQRVDDWTVKIVIPPVAQYTTLHGESVTFSVIPGSVMLSGVDVPVNGMFFRLISSFTDVSKANISIAAAPLPIVPTSPPATSSATPPTSSTTGPDHVNHAVCHSVHAVLALLCLLCIL